MGHICRIEPMLRIAALPDSPLDLRGVQAILLTSANGARALAERPAPRDLPVLAVGDATAQAAREAGFEVVDSAAGDVVALAALVRRRLRADGGALLHVAGTAVAGDLAGDLSRDGYAVRRAVLYRAEAAQSLSRHCAEALMGGELDAVVFFSPRSAATFVELIGRRGLDSTVQELDMYALSNAVVSAASGLPWRAIHVADEPRKPALLTLLNPG